MVRLLCIVIGYLIGCIQSAYFVGKLMKVDLRQHGSGNLGSTNALRVLGKKAGAITFACDVCKCILAFVLCSVVFSKSEMQGVGIYACYGVILGHDFPFYLRFKGGKGIASMIGMVFCLAFLYGSSVLFITFGLGILALCTKYVSVGSIAFSVAIPITVYILGLPIDCFVMTVLLAILALWRHKENIKRLLAGTENKLGAKSKT